MTYQPNIQDPRVRKRIGTAYAFTRAVFTHKPKDWSTRFIQQYFGKNKLGTWLRSHLLICTNHHYNSLTGKCKYYKINSQGADYIRQLLIGISAHDQDRETPEFDWGYIDLLQKQQFDQQVIVKFIQKEYGDELTNKDFKYSIKENRFFNPIQNIRSEYRTQALSLYGLKYQYDIEAAAPNLIHQHSQHLGMDLYLFALREYLNNRALVRTRLSRELDIDIKKAKILINALFCGARVGHGADFALSALLDHDPSRILWLKQDTYINQLRDDIKTCWEYIQPTMTRRTNARGRLIPITPREKWLRYFELERTCMTPVIKYMKLNNIKYFLEHDGWTCDREIDIDELKTCVRNQTGFDVNFDRKYNMNKIDRLSRRDRLDCLI